MYTHAPTFWHFILGNAIPSAILPGMSFSTLHPLHVSSGILPPEKLVPLPEGLSGALPLGIASRHFSQLSHLYW